MVSLKTVKNLVTFGTGFLLGSRAGRGPWEFVEAKVKEAQGARAGEISLDSSTDGRLPITSA